MKQENIYKIAPIFISVFVFCFAIVFYALGWTEPAVAPPGGNVDVPINVGGTGQSKAGGLVLNTGGAANGLIVQNGKVGIGTASPSQKLDVVGQIHATQDICTDAGGGKCLGTIGGGSGPITYVSCEVAITGTDFSGSSEQCAVTVYYDGLTKVFETAEHGDVSWEVCWRDADSSLKHGLVFGPEYSYLGRVANNPTVIGERVGCVMAKVNL